MLGRIGAKTGRAIYAGRPASASPATGLAARHKAEQEALVEAALTLPERDAAESLARALRAMLASVPGAGGSELDQLLGECDARSYAPSGAGSGALPAELQTRARKLAGELEEAGQ